MKILKKPLKLIGLLALMISLFVGINFSVKRYTYYRDIENLSNTVLGINTNPSDREESINLQQGQIHSKILIDLSTIGPLWRNFTVDDVLKSDFRYLDDINFFAISYKSDSLLVNGIIAEPKKEGKFPVIIFNRGGNKEIGKVAKLKTLYYLISLTSKLAKEGYVVIASCYREDDEFGGKDINDVLNLSKTVTYLQKADSERIGMFGWSRGGMMTYLALRKSKIIKTAVIGNGPTDLAQLITERPEMETEVCAKLIPDYKNNKKAALEKRSVMYWADELDKNASLLILCGTEDKRVNPNQAQQIADKLAEINYDFTLKKFKTDHKFSGKTEELNALLINWFNTRLKKQVP
jgi:dipeptidyl aminopeptidase/acylaminoacyl peptidase